MADKEPKKRTDNGGRNANGTFAPGNKGGTGRPKKPIELDRLARESLTELETIAKNPNTPVKVRSDIWRFFYEQKHGKAPQAIGLDGKVNLQPVVFTGSDDIAD